MSDRYAPEGKLWLCMMCSKTTKDAYGEERGWDESCASNCILVDEGEGPTEEQVYQFYEQREQRLAAAQQRMRELREQIRSGTYKPDPELLALAEEAIRQQDAAKAASPPMDRTGEIGKA